MNARANLSGGVVLMLNLAVGQGVAPKVEQWNTIDRLCGALLHVERRVRRDNVIEEHTRTLKNVLLKLYERNNVAYCEGAKALADVTTGRGGKFSFKNLKPRSYWLTTFVNGRHYKMPLRLQTRSSDTRTQCSDQRFEVEDSGEFQIGKTITVD